MTRKLGAAQGKKELMGVPLVLLLHRGMIFGGISLSLFFQALFTVALKCSFAVYGDHRVHQKASGLEKDASAQNQKGVYFCIHIPLLLSYPAVQHTFFPVWKLHIYIVKPLLHTEEIFNDCLSWLPGFLCSWAKKKLVVLNNWLCLDGLHSSEPLWVPDTPCQHIFGYY